MYLKEKGPSRRSRAQGSVGKEDSGEIRSQFIEQEPGPRGSPHEPQAPTGICVAPDAGLEVLAANTDCRFSSVVPWHDGHSGVEAPRVSHSNR